MISMARAYPMGGYQAAVCSRIQVPPLLRQAGQALFTGQMRRPGAVKTLHDESLDVVKLQRMAGRHLQHDLERDQ